jgi:hypothetical protein
LEFRQEGRGLRLVADGDDLLFVPVVFDPYGVLDRMETQRQRPELRVSLSAAELLRAISSLAGTASTLDVLVSGGQLSGPQAVAFSARGELATVAIEFATLQHEDSQGSDPCSYSYSYSVERVELVLAPEGLLRVRGARLPHFSQVCALLPV